jgi:hypothetical protein
LVAGTEPVNQRMEPIMTKPKKTTKPSSRKAKTTKAAGTAGQGGSTKLAQLEAMLRRPEGAAIAQLSKTLGWQPHSVRGAMSGELKKKRGLNITASKEKGADRIYRIAG